MESYRDKGLGDAASESGPGSTLYSSPENGLRGAAPIPIARPLLDLLASVQFDLAVVGGVMPSTRVEVERVLAAYGRDITPDYAEST